MAESRLNKLAEGIMIHIRQAEKEIREDERKKVLAELEEQGRIKPDKKEKGKAL